MKIRPAKVTDVKAMHALIGYYAERKEMLPRPVNDIYENIQEFVVAEDKGKLVACCALHVSWEDLAEIKALAVAQSYQKKGIGTKLVKALHERARELGVKKVFALTFKPKFFLGLGYGQISREKLPHKIWGECVKCPQFPDCGEIPLIRSLAKK
jgi:N-acetylglutamate synthase and related acetyltransferases